MYEQPGAPVPAAQRIIWIILWFIIIAAIVWVFVWLLFFRGHTNTGLQTGKTPQGQSQSSGGQSKSGGGQSATSGQSQQSSGSTGSTSAASLANAGAGNVFIPVGVAVVAGTVASYCVQIAAARSTRSRA